MNAAKDLFSQYISDTPKLLEEVLNEENPINDAANLLKNSRKIFVTGSGSSLPAAKYLTDYLRTNSNITPYFLSTSELISTSDINSDDTIVLVSQGFNRSDGIIVGDFTAQKGADLLLATANRDDNVDAIVKLFFSPTAAEERLFCRPAGVITSYALLAKLAHSITGETFDNDKCLSAISSATIDEQTSNSAYNADITIVLSSGLMLGSASNIALSLREGAGKVASAFEIEYYAHGQYAPHTKLIQQDKTVNYILISSDSDKVSSRAVDRILPLIKELNTPYTLWHHSSNPTYAGLTVLRQGGLLVQDVLSKSNYDMNHPLGMEENRGFHLVAANYYRD